MASLTRAKFAKTVRYTVSFTTSLSDAPAASATASRFRDSLDLISILPPAGPCRIRPICPDNTACRLNARPESSAIAAGAFGVERSIVSC